jgi:WD40 repeat protein
LDEHVRRVAWSSDGQRFLSSGLDHKVRLWDINKPDPVRLFERHAGTVYAAVFTPDERFVVSPSQDNTVRFWDLKSGKELVTHREGSGEIYTIQLSRDGRSLLSTGGARARAARLYRLPQSLWPIEK